MSITINKASGGGSSNVNTGTISVTVPALAAGAIGDDASTIVGLTDGDFIFVTPANAGFEDGLTFSCYISAADTLTINFVNNSGSTLAGSTENWRYIWIPA